MAEKFIHIKPGEEVRSISGHYVIEKELRLPISGREALVLIGHMIIDRSCCGTGACRYALVPGLLTGAAGVEENGAPFSEVDPVEDISLQETISVSIEKLEFVNQVIFL